MTKNTGSRRKSIEETLKNPKVIYASSVLLIFLWLLILTIFDIPSSLSNTSGSRLTEGTLDIFIFTPIVLLSLGVGYGYSQILQESKIPKSILACIAFVISIVISSYVFQLLSVLFYLA